MPKILVKALLAQKVDGCQRALQSLIDVAEYASTFVRPHLGACLERMTQIAENTQIDDGCRGSALEFLISLSEHAPGMCRKDPNFPRGKPGGQMTS